MKTHSYSNEHWTISLVIHEDDTSEIHVNPVTDDFNNAASLESLEALMKSMVEEHNDVSINTR